MHITSRCSKPVSHLSLTWPKLSCPSMWLHRVNRERQIHSPGGMTTWPGFPYSVRPLDVTWRPLQWSRSERLFSSTGDITDDKQTFLLTENLECLVFIEANLMWNCVNVNDESRWWMMDGRDNNDDELQLWRWMIMKSLQSSKQLCILFVFGQTIVSIIHKLILLYFKERKTSTGSVRWMNKINTKISDKSKFENQRCGFRTWNFGVDLVHSLYWASWCFPLFKIQLNQFMNNWNYENTAKSVLALENSNCSNVKGETQSSLPSLSLCDTWMWCYLHFIVSSQHWA